MSRIDVLHECDPKVMVRKKEIEQIEDEIQCMESCLGEGFTLRDYIETQKHLIDILKGLNKSL